jgi:hypothetical protein
MGLPARNPQLLVTQFRKAASAAERTSGHGCGGGALYGLSAFRRSNSGSLAKFAAMQRASSRVSSLAAERRPGSSSKIEIRKRLCGAVAHDEAGVVRLIERPPRREAARGGHGAMGSTGMAMPTRPYYAKPLRATLSVAHAGSYHDGH